LIGGNRNSTAYYFKRLCEIFVHQLDQESHEVFAGEIEVDESYFGGTLKGK
jgi:transposase